MKRGVAFWSIGLAAMCALRVLTLASGVGAAEPRAITVHGEGVVRTTPDLTEFDAGVVAEAADAAAALATASQTARRLIAVLAEHGVPDQNVRSRVIGLNPRYATQSAQHGTTRRIVGYAASHQLNVRLSDIDKLGGLIDALVGAGANQIGAVRFSLENGAKAEKAARVAALADARDRAALYAREAGVTLGPVLHVAEAGAMPAPIMRREFSLQSSATPVAPGALEVRARLTVTFGIY